MVNNFPESAADEYYNSLYSLQSYCASFSKPLIVNVSGDIRGSGAAMAMSLPYTFAAPGTKCSFKECKIGYIPDGGSLFFLSRLPGYIGSFIALTGYELNERDLVHLKLFDAVHDGINDIVNTELPLIDGFYNKRNYFEYQKDSSLIFEGVLDANDIKNYDENSFKNFLNKLEHYDIYNKNSGYIDKTEVFHIAKEFFEEKSNSAKYNSQNLYTNNYKINHNYTFHFDLFNDLLIKRYFLNRDNDLNNDPNKKIYFNSESIDELKKGFSLQKYLGTINRCFKHDSISNIKEALKKEGTSFALKALNNIETSSYEAMQVAHYIIKIGKTLDYSAVLKLEATAARNMMLKNPDLSNIINYNLHKKTEIDNYFLNKKAQNLSLEDTLEKYFNKENKIKLPEYLFLPHKHYFYTFPDTALYYLNNKQDPTNRIDIKNGEEAKEFFNEQLDLDLDRMNVDFDKIKQIMIAIKNMMLEKDSIMEKINVFSSDKQNLDAYFNKIELEINNMFNHDKNFGKKYIDDIIKQVYNEFNKDFINNIEKECSKLAEFEKRRFFISLKKYLFVSLLEKTRYSEENKLQNKLKTNNLKNTDQNKDVLKHYFELMYNELSNIKKTYNEENYPEQKKILEEIKAKETISYNTIKQKLNDLEKKLIFKNADTLDILFDTSKLDFEDKIQKLLNDKINLISLKFELFSLKYKNINKYENLIKEKSSIEDSIYIKDINKLEKDLNEVNELNKKFNSLRVINTSSKSSNIHNNNTSQIINMINKIKEEKSKNKRFLNLIFDIKNNSILNTDTNEDNKKALLDAIFMYIERNPLFSKDKDYYKKNLDQLLDKEDYDNSIKSIMKSNYMKFKQNHEEINNDELVNLSQLKNSAENYLKFEKQDNINSDNKDIDDYSIIDAIYNRHGENKIEDKNNKNIVKNDTSSNYLKYFNNLPDNNESLKFINSLSENELNLFNKTIDKYIDKLSTIKKDKQLEDNYEKKLIKVNNNNNDDDTNTDNNNELSLNNNFKKNKNTNMSQKSKQDFNNINKSNIINNFSNIIYSELSSKIKNIDQKTISLLIENIIENKLNNVDFFATDSNKNSYLDIIKKLGQKISFEKEDFDIFNIDKEFLIENFNADYEEEIKKALFLIDKICQNQDNISNENKELMFYIKIAINFNKIKLLYQYNNTLELLAADTEEDSNDSEDEESNEKKIKENAKKAMENKNNNNKDKTNLKNTLENYLHEDEDDKKLSEAKLLEKSYEDKLKEAENIVKNQEIKETHDNIEKIFKKYKMGDLLLKIKSKHFDPSLNNKLSTEEDRILQMILEIEHNHKFNNTNIQTLLSNYSYLILNNNKIKINYLLSSKNDLYINNKEELDEHNNLTTMLSTFNNDNINNIINNDEYKISNSKYSSKVFNSQNVLTKAKNYLDSIVDDDKYLKDITNLENDKEEVNSKKVSKIEDAKKFFNIPDFYEDSLLYKLLNTDNKSISSLYNNKDETLVSQFNEYNPELEHIFSDKVPKPLYEAAFKTYEARVIKAIKLLLVTIKIKHIQMKDGTNFNFDSMIETFTSKLGLKENYTYNKGYDYEIGPSMKEIDKMLDYEIENTYSTLYPNNLEKLNINPNYKKKIYIPYFNNPHKTITNIDNIFALRSNFNEVIGDNNNNSKDNNTIDISNNNVRKFDELDFFNKNKAKIINKITKAIPKPEFDDRFSVMKYIHDYYVGDLRIEYENSFEKTVQSILDLEFVSEVHKLKVDYIKVKAELDSTDYNLYSELNFGPASLLINYKNKNPEKVKELLKEKTSNLDFSDYLYYGKTYLLNEDEHEIYFKNKEFNFESVRDFNRFYNKFNGTIHEAYEFYRRNYIRNNYVNEEVSNIEKELYDKYLTEVNFQKLIKSNLISYKKYKSDVKKFIEDDIKERRFREGGFYYEKGAVHINETNQCYIDIMKRVDRMINYEHLIHKKKELLNKIKQAENIARQHNISLDIDESNLKLEKEVEKIIKLKSSNNLKGKDFNTISDNVISLDQEIKEIEKKAYITYNKEDEIEFKMKHLGDLMYLKKHLRPILNREAKTNSIFDSLINNNNKTNFSSNDYINSLIQKRKKITIDDEIPLKLANRYNSLLEQIQKLNKYNYLNNSISTEDFIKERFKKHITEYFKNLNNVELLCSNRELNYVHKEFNIYEKYNLLNKSSFKEFLISIVHKEKILFEEKLDEFNNLNLKKVDNNIQNKLKTRNLSYFESFNSQMYLLKLAREARDMREFKDTSADDRLVEYEKYKNETTKKLVDSEMDNNYYKTDMHPRDRIIKSFIKLRDPYAGESINSSTDREIKIMMKDKFDALNSFSINKFNDKYSSFKSIINKKL